MLPRKARDGALVTVYCDESGGIGRGVMTLAAVRITPDVAGQLLADFRLATGLTGELKGSRIDLQERGLFFTLFAKTGALAVVSIAISALKPSPGEGRGHRDQLTYAALLEDCISAALVQEGGCSSVIIDDGRYDALALDHIRADLAVMTGPCGEAKLELSHRSAGLQIADVIANTFFNRALVSERQSQMAEFVAPFLELGSIEMRILSNDART